MNTSANTATGAILITGASSGMGKACALRLAREGYTAFAGVRKEQDAQALRQGGVGLAKAIRLLRSTRV